MIKNTSYVLKFIYSKRFMANSLSNFVNNLSKGIHKSKCKFRLEDEKCETCKMI